MITPDIGDRSPRAKYRARTAPNASPMDHVAATPQHNPSSVGDRVGKSGGCATLKYSVQTRTVTWSCATP